MKYSFDKDFATRYDIDCAIMIDNLVYWQAKNQANNHNFIEEKYWTYNKRSAFVELMPFFNNEQKVKRILDKLEANGIIEIANHNKDKRDQTLWYTVIDEWTLQLYNLQLTNMLLETNKSVTSQSTDLLDDNKETISKTTLVKPINKHIQPECVSHESALEIISNFQKTKFSKSDLIESFGIDSEVVESYIEVRNAKKAPLTKLAFKKLVCQAKDAGLTIEEAMTVCAERNWVGFEASWVKSDNPVSKESSISTEFEDYESANWGMRS